MRVAMTQKLQQAVQHLKVPQLTRLSNYLALTQNKCGKSGQTEPEPARAQASLNGPGKCADCGAN